MSLKDDFFEALNSVKKDIFNSPEGAQNAAETRAPEPEPVITAPETVTQPLYVSPDPEDNVPPPPMSDKSVFDAFERASAMDDRDDFADRRTDYSAGSAYEESPVHSDDNVYGGGAPSMPDFGGFREPSASDSGVFSSPPAVNDYNNSPGAYDFDRTELYSDDKTVISRNTIIRGALQTDDSVRLLGQVLGDIDCKSNIVIAGKVRGNTSAANAYIMDAQIDGGLQCDDVVSISSDAWVLGDIRAQQAEIDGKVKGNLDIRHTISIGSTSSIIGNISTDELEIKRGAFVNGQIAMFTPSRDVLDRFEHFEK